MEPWGLNLQEPLQQSWINESIIMFEEFKFTWRKEGTCKHWSIQVRNVRGVSIWSAHTNVAQPFSCCFVDINRHCASTIYDVKPTEHCISYNSASISPPDSFINYIFLDRWEHTRKAKLWFFIYFYIFYRFVYFLKHCNYYFESEGIIFIVLPQKFTCWTRCFILKYEEAFSKLSNCL